MIPGKIKEQLLSTNEAHMQIKQFILDGKPALIARFGGNEAECTVKGIGIRLKAKKDFENKILRRMYLNAGVFPYGKEMALRFSDISKWAAEQVDLLGWWMPFMQDYLALEICRKDVMLTRLGCLEPYYSDVPWTAALKGKKYWLYTPSKNP